MHSGSADALTMRGMCVKQRASAWRYAIRRPSNRSPEMAQVKFEDSRGSAFEFVLPAGHCDGKGGAREIKNCLRSFSWMTTRPTLLLRKKRRPGAGIKAGWMLQLIIDLNLKRTGKNLVRLRAPATRGKRWRKAPAQVLLIEDNPGDADLVRLRLTEGKSEVQVNCVPRLSDALACLEAETPSLVLLDLNLPRQPRCGDFSPDHAEGPECPSGDPFGDKTTRRWRSRQSTWACRII